VQALENAEVDLALALLEVVHHELLAPGHLALVELAVRVVEQVAGHHLDEPVVLNLRVLLLKQFYLLQGQHLLLGPVLGQDADGVLGILLGHFLTAVVNRRGQDHVRLEVNLEVQLGLRVGLVRPKQHCDVDLA